MTPTLYFGLSENWWNLWKEIESCIFLYFVIFELVFTDLNYMFIFSVSIAPEIWIGLKSTVPECDTKNKWVQWGQINTMWVAYLKTNLLN